MLILKADQLAAAALQGYAQKTFPSAHVILVGSVDAAQLALAARPADLVIVGMDSRYEGDVLSLLAHCAGHPTRPPHILALVDRHETHLLAMLRILEIEGVFDPIAEPPSQLETALVNVAAGRRYWSASLTAHMQSGGPTNSLYRSLTAFEQLVLVVIGDGCDDAVAARELDVSPATISTVRRNLHRKLRVQHRGELIRIAAQHGFVRFTPHGVLRQGYTTLAAIHRHRHRTRAVETPVVMPVASPAVMRPAAPEVALPAA